MTTDKTTDKTKKAPAKAEQPVRIPDPLCPETWEVFTQCMADKKYQYKCIAEIQDHNKCMRKMMYHP